MMGGCDGGTFAPGLGGPGWDDAVCASVAHDGDLSSWSALHGFPAAGVNPRRNEVNGLDDRFGNPAGRMLPTDRPEAQLSVLAPLSLGVLARAAFENLTARSILDIGPCCGRGGSAPPANGKRKPPDSQLESSTSRAIAGSGSAASVGGHDRQSATGTGGPCVDASSRDAEGLDR